MLAPKARIVSHHYACDSQAAVEVQEGNRGELKWAVKSELYMSDTVGTALTTSLTHRERKKRVRIT